MAGDDDHTQEYAVHIYKVGGVVIILVRIIISGSLINDVSTYRLAIEGV